MTPAGIITTFAGNGNSTRIAIDSTGNVYISDPDNHRIRRVTTDGVIQTFAGNGTAGFRGDGGQALQASLQSPAGLAFDPAGSLVPTLSGLYQVNAVIPTGVTGDKVPLLLTSNGNAAPTVTLAVH